MQLYSTAFFLDEVRCFGMRIEVLVLRRSRESRQGAGNGRSAEVGDARVRVHEGRHLPLANSRFTNFKVGLSDGARERGTLSGPWRSCRSKLLSIQI